MNAFALIRFANGGTLELEIEASGEMLISMADQGAHVATAMINRADLDRAIAMLIGFLAADVAPVVELVEGA